MPLTHQVVKTIDVSEFGSITDVHSVPNQTKVLGVSGSSFDDEPKLVLVDLQSGQANRLPIARDSVLGISYDGQRIVSGSWPTVWSLADGQPCGTYIDYEIDEDFDAEIVDIAFVPNEKQVVLSTRKGFVGCWDLDGPSLRWKARVSEVDDYPKLSFLNGGTQILASGRKIALLDAATGEVVWKRHHNYFEITGLHENGMLVGANMNFYLWRQLDHGRQVKRIRRERFTTGHLSGVEAWAPDRRVHVDEHERGLLLYGPQSGTVLGIIERMTDQIDSACFSSDSRQLIVATRDDDLYVYELSDFADNWGTPEEEFTIPDDWQRTQEADAFEQQIEQANVNCRFRSNRHEGFDLLRLPGILETIHRVVRMHPVATEQFDPAASKIGGTFLWPVDEPFPACKEHDSRLLPILQLRRDDLPELRFIPGMDLMQMLWCPHHHEDRNYGPKVELIWRAEGRIDETEQEMPMPTDFAEPSLIPEPCTLHLERYAFFDMRRLPEAVSDDLERLKQSDPEIAADIRAYALPEGCRIGGVPKWINEPREPACPRCEASVDFLLAMYDVELQANPVTADDVVQMPKDLDAWSKQYRLQRPTGLCFGDGAELLVYYCYACEEVVTLVEGY